MSTLAEIEAALPGLTVEELGALAGRLAEMKSSGVEKRRVVTGDDAVRWWREIEHLPPAEAEAFARDVESGRAELNRIPSAPPRG